MLYFLSFYPHFLMTLIILVKTQNMASCLLYNFLQNRVTLPVWIPATAFSPALHSHTITFDVISSGWDQDSGLHHAEQKEKTQFKFFVCRGHISSRLTEALTFLTCTGVEGGPIATETSTTPTEVCHGFAQSVQIILRISLHQIRPQQLPCIFF
jgi:hypothetical protein